MPLLSAENADQVRSFLADHLQEPVTIDLYTQSRSLLTIPGQRDCEYCEATEQLLDEVAGLSDKLSVSVHDLRTNPAAGEGEGLTAELTPTIVVRGEGQGTVRFLGIPAGNEFSTLIQDIASVSSGTTSLAQTTREELAKLPGETHIRVFVTPT